MTALIAERDRLADELARRLVELSLVQELTHILSASLQLDRVVGEVASYAMRASDASGAAVLLTGEDGHTLEVLAAEGALAHCLGRTLDVEADSLVSEAIGHERLEWRNTDRDDGVLLCEPERARSAVVAPLRAHGVTTGAVVVMNKRSGGFTDEDARLLSTVASHAAVVLANARFFELIRRGKEQWEATFDALADGIALVDREGRVRRANGAFAEIARQPIRAVVGSHLCHILFHEHMTLAELLSAANRGERPAPMVRRSESLGRTLRVVAAPVAGPAAEAAAVVVVEDITEQKALEAQLIQSEKMAAVGTLVSGVAHELNNPLTSIVGLSEFLLEQPPGGEHEREHLRVINDQAERASRIVRNLLSFARKAPSERAPLDLGEVVQRTVQLMDYEMKQRGIAVETTFPADLPPVVGNRDQLQQVALNLLQNAGQALATLPDGRPRRIEVVAEAEGDRVTLRITDSGPGIAPEAASHIFDPFFTTKPPGEGTGLGLFLSYGVAEAHGGTLSVDPRPGEGASFLLALPCAAPGASVTAASRRSGPQVVTAVSGPARRILVVDDDPAVQRLVTALFTREGHHVDAAADGAAALGLVGSADYDLVISDRRIAAGGEPFVDALRKLRPAWATRVIVSTSQGRRSISGTDRDETAASRVLRKPFNLRDLRAAAAAVWEAAGTA